MLVFSRFFRVYPFAISTVFLFLVGSGMAASQVSEPLEPRMPGQSISLVIWTERAKYSLRDAVKLNASLENTGDARVFVDRRMFWTGFGGGLKLEISDERGKTIPVRLLSDAIMPPPREGDTSILVPLDEGFSYGTSVNLRVADIFKKPGRYAIRVIYKSWLSKGNVAPQLRDLPALWSDSPEIASKQLWIIVTR